MLQALYHQPCFDTLPCSSSDSFLTCLSKIHRRHATPFTSQACKGGSITCRGAKGNSKQTEPESRLQISNRCQDSRSRVNECEQYVNRRANLAALVATAAACFAEAPARAVELSPSQEEARLSSPVSEIDTTITERVYLDIGLCPEMLNRARRVGDQSALCAEPASLGRIVIGLYGKHLPQTTENFRRAVSNGLYTGTIFHRILPGAFIQAGRQGSKRLGEVWIPKDTQSANPEVLQGRSYRLPHLRPGSVSLVLSQNDDYPDIKQGRDYRNAQFLITTGPGPVPVLDEENIVFGRVLDGFDTINSITQVPTFKPGDSARQMNAFASFLGDERAAKAKQKWGRPLKAVVITAGGVVA